MTDMVEKVARAIAAEQWPLSSPEEKASWVRVRWHSFVPSARAAIEAMREPTQRMREAAGKYANFCAAHNYGGCPDAEGTWEAMIDAALAPQSLADPLSDPKIPASETPAKPL